MQFGVVLCVAFFLISQTFFLSLTAPAQSYPSRNLKNQKTKEKDDDGEPWKSIPLLIETPKRRYDIIGNVHAPRIFLWDDDESIKEALQKRAWEMSADAVLLDIVDTNIQWKPTPGAKGRAIRYIK